jgi:putative membrane protein
VPRGTLSRDAREKPATHRKAHLEYSRQEGYIPMPKRTILAGIAGAALMAGLAAAQSSGSANRLAGPDLNFVNNAAAGGLAEVELGQLAQQKATNDQVKQFGKRMVDDHTRLNNELKAIAHSKGLTPPTALTGKHEKTKQDLSAKSAQDFDRAYMKHMVDDHQQDVAEFKNEADNGLDPEVKAFAKSALPTLQEHLRMAQQAEASLGGSR